MNLNSISMSMAIAATIGAGGDPAFSSTQSISDQDSTSLNSSGTGVGNVDGIYRNYNFSVVNGTPVVIDLTNIKDPNGGTLTVANVVAFKIRNLNPIATGGILTYGGGSNPVIVAQLPLEPQGKAGWDGITNGGIGLPIAGGTKNLQFTSSVGTIKVAVTLLLRSA